MHASFKKFAWIYGVGNGNPLQYSWLENPLDKEAGRLLQGYSTRGHKESGHNLATKQQPM